MAGPASHWSWVRRVTAAVALVVAAVFAGYVVSQFAGPDRAASSTAPTSTTTSPTTTVASTTTGSVTGPCGPANSLAAIGDAERATRAYQAVLQADPASQCAVSGLVALSSVAKPAKPDICAVGKALREAGAATEAKAALVDAVKAGSACAADELDRATAPSNAERANNVVTGAGKYLALLGLLAIVGYIVTTPLSSRRWQTLQMLRKPSLVFDPLKEPSVDPKPAAAVTALAAAAFHQLDDATVWPTLSQVDAHLELSAVLDLEKVLPQLGAAAAVLRVAERLAGAPRLTVSGQLHPAGSTGPGLTIRLADRNGIVDVDTARLPPLQAGKAATEESFGDLAVFAAAWTRHQAGKSLKQEPPTLTTHDSVSYAWLVTGQAAAARGAHDAALASYRMAVDADPGHMRALIQRALALTDTDVDYALVCEALTQISDILEAILV